METDQLVKQVETMEEFAGLPALVLDLMGLINDPGTSIQDLVKRLELDAALAAYLLKHCNSAASGIREEIRSLPRAVALLGYSKLKMIFSDYMMRNLYRLGQTDEEQLYQWKHATAVAVLNRFLAVRLKITEDEAYLAGLLHDIGRLAMIHIDKNRFFYFRQVWLDEKPENPTQLERKLFGHSHDLVGNILLDHWRFSEYLKEVVRYHHTALRYQGTNPSVPLTALSNSIVHNLFDNHVQPLGDLLSQCGIQLIEINEILPRARREIEAAWALAND